MAMEQDSRWLWERWLASDKSHCPSDIYDNHDISSNDGIDRGHERHSANEAVSDSAFLLGRISTPSPLEPKQCIAGSPVKPGLRQDEDEDELRVFLALVMAIIQAFGFLGTDPQKISRGATHLRIRRHACQPESLTPVGMRVLICLSAGIMQTLHFLGIEHLVYHDDGNAAVAARVRIRVNADGGRGVRPDNTTSVCSQKGKAATPGSEARSKHWARVLDRWAANEEEQQREQWDTIDEEEAKWPDPRSFLPVPDLAPIPIGPHGITGPPMSHHESEGPLHLR